jgi:UDP-2,3-diacylglucosamine pyrophosphatase LpxH
VEKLIHDQFPAAESKPEHYSLRTFNHSCPVQEDLCSGAGRPLTRIEPIPLPIAPSRKEVRKMKKPTYDTVILSDLHLGAETSRANEAVEVLQGMEFRRLILLGDIFADLNFGRLKKHHWQFLSYIRKLSNPKRGIEVVWVEGNHDAGLTEVMSHLVGIPVYQEYAWQHAGEWHLAIHGHQFDGFVLNNSLLCNVFGGQLYLFLQKLDSKRKWLSQLLDKLSTRWLRMTTKVANGAIARARECGAKRVFCGHTHESIAIERDGIRYFNTGAWTTNIPTFVTIAGEEITIHEHVIDEYSGRIDDRRASEERVDPVAAVAGFAVAPGLSIACDYEGVYC